MTPQTKEGSGGNMTEYDYSVGGVEPYRWMFKWGNGEIGVDDGKIIGHRGWTFKDIREAYERIPVTGASFKPLTLIEDDVHYSVSQPMLAYLGSWDMPDRFADMHDSHWVNHEAKWAVKYSDGAVVCPNCGAVKYFTENSMRGKDFDQEHDDDCTKIHEHRVKMLTWQKRDRMLRQSALFHLPKRRVAERIGLTDESVGTHCKILNIDYEGLQWHGYRKWRATMVTLQEEFGLARRELADIYGKNRSTLREHINGNLRPYKYCEETTTMAGGVISDD